MASLNTSLWTGLSALNADQSLIDVSSNNIANADNPSYSRQTVNVSEATPLQLGNASFGTGVSVGDISTTRNAALDLLIARDQSSQAASDQYANVLRQVQPAFEDNGSGIGTGISSFFGAWVQLSANPSNPSLRQQVLSSAQQFTDAVHNAQASIDSTLTSNDLSLQQDVTTANGLLSDIARLNSNATATPALADERAAKISQLASLMGVAIVPSGNGVELTTEAGIPLVMGQTAAHLTISSANGTQSVFADGQDIGPGLQGSIGGTLQAQQTTLPALANNLDALAYSIGTSVNQAYGGTFFTLPAGQNGAASAISVAVSDPSSLVTGVAGDAGDNSVANAVAAVHGANVARGTTATNFLSGMVFQLGNEISSAQAESSASSQSAQQLRAQQAAVSGVSLDTEAANLVRYQQAYEAAARIVTTVDSMSLAAINLGIETAAA